MPFYSIFRFFYLLGAVNALFFAFLIFSRSNRKRSDVILGVWLVFLSAQLMIPFIYMTNIRVYTYMVGYESTLLTLHPIFLYNYVLTLTNEKRKLKSILLSFSPAILVGIMMYPYFQMPMEVKYRFVNSGERIPLNVLPSVIVSGGCFIWYIVATFKALKKHKQQILQVYSYRDNVDLLWLRRLAVTFSFFFFFDMGLAIVFSIIEIPLAWTDFSFYIMLTFFIFILGYFGYRQGEIFRFEPLNIAREAHESRAKEELHDHKAEIPVINEADAQKLSALMKEEQPFLESSLTINDLSRMMDMPPHQLSRVINRHFGMNFFEYVNQYRIEYFKQLAADPKYQHYSLLGLGLECGFNSKSSFNRVFKEHTGLTPGAVRKQIEAELVSQ
ncbi:transcriptional regulator [Prolixibacter bellariivorans]|uniref:Transcriptional regulator n=1 Tax=Prolixibacter bellariivorans TaxID=314319 RepID=A0A5M4AXQ8_9BACT|nr:helix-turn-helix domain-containing protein [Prolixibacter bellariivorans]GET32376.1 transcriptional regulator [Prolixibacter bellariivorans]